MTSTAVASSAMRTTASTMIETHGLAKTYQSGRKAVEAVRGVDLEVREGEIFGFLGPNGAGKTTTMRILTTLMPPSGGRPPSVATTCGAIRAASAAASATSARRAARSRWKPAARTCVMQGRVYGMSAKRRCAARAELVDPLDMETLPTAWSRRTPAGSGAASTWRWASCTGPRLLFLDEPTTGLDPQSRARIWDEVRRLHDRGMTIFLTTHYMDEADGLCDRLAIIDHGAIVSLDTPDALKRQIAGDIITLGLDTADAERVTERCARSPSSARLSRRSRACGSMSIAAKRCCQRCCACSTSSASPFAPSRWRGQRSKTSSCGGPGALSASVTSTGQ